MSTTNTNPIATMTATERNLASAINATAEALDVVGTTTIAAAMARLKESAEGAKTRINAAKVELASVVAGVLAELDGFAMEIVQALEANVVVALPAIAYSDDEVIDLDAKPIAETIPADDGEIIDLNADGVIVPVVKMAANSPATKRSHKKRR